MAGGSMSICYTYYSYEEFGRGYIGYRKCPEGFSPEDDPYMGSYSDKSFKPTSKIVLTTHNSKEEAINAEMEIQKLYSVVTNPHFVNRCYQSSTGFYSNQSGSNHSEKSKRKMSEAHRGKKLSKDHVEKITGRNNSRYTPRDWYHPEHGEVLDRSLSDLAKMYPNQKLDTSSLSKVARGKIFHSKGWRLLENKGEDRQYGIPRSWCHTEYGFLHNSTASDIVKKYPADDLSTAGLCSVCFGRSKYYKGWIFIDNSLINTSLTMGELSKIFSTEYAKGEINKRKSNKKPRKNKSTGIIIRDWYHPDHKIIRQVGVYVISKNYSHSVKLYPASLYKVAYGKMSQYHGWRILDPTSGPP